MPWVDIADLRGSKGEKGEQGEQGIISPSVDNRLDLLEELASTPGSRVVNTVSDPIPADPASTYQVGHIGAVTAPAPNWARAIATGGGQATIRPYLMDADQEALVLDVEPGQTVGFTVTLRAMLDQDISATVHVEGFDSGAARGSILTDGQHTMEAGQSRRFTAVGAVPADVDQVSLMITFRTRGETYPLEGHSLYWREAALYAGNVPASTSFVSGDQENSYWEGEPSRSASVTFTPKGEGTGGGAGAVARRAAIVDAGERRRGGPIGTAGLPVISLRFDHHFAQFNSKVVPLLRQYRLPWSQMVNIGNFGTGDDTLTTTQVADLCYTSGGELWNHGYSHTNMPDEATADREITQGRTDLVEAFPGLWIDGWAPPGQSSMMGYEGYDTVEKMWDTYPGRLAMSQHAFVRGRFPGAYYRLSGRNLVGASHYTMDTYDYAHMAAVIRGAVNARAGVTLMLHPNYLDQPGYMTTGVLGQILAFIAQLRDDEEVLVLTNTAVLLADSGRTDRWSLVTGEQAVPGSVSGEWSQTISPRSAAAQYGVPHEAVAKVVASQAGDFTLRVLVTHGAGVIDQQQIATLAAGATATLRVLVTPPMDTVSTEIRLSGEGEHEGVRYWSV